MKKAGKHIASAAIIMVFVTMLSKVLGLLRDMLLASTFGTGTSAAAYETASRIPITLFDFALGGVVTAAFIPVFNEIMIKNGRDKAFEYANKYFNLIFMITLTISVVGMVLSGPLVSFLAPEASASVKVLATHLSRIMFPMIIFTGIAYCFVGILQSFEKYTLPAIMSLVSNLVMVLYFYTLSTKYDVWGLSVALVIGWFLQAAIQAPAAYKLGFRFKPTVKFKDEYIIRSLKMALPILVCSWLQPVCNVINTRFASGFEGDSGITMVNYANRLYIIIVGVFSFVATNLLFPRLSRSEAEGDNSGARKFAASSVKILLYLMIPLAAGIFFLAEPITRVLYMRDAFTAHDAEMTASVLRLLALGIPFMSANEVLTKLFFAMQKVKGPMIASLSAICVNILLVTVLVNSIGFDGIAIASSVTIAVCVVINYIILSHKEALLCGKDFFDILKSVVSTLVMCGAIYIIDSNLSISLDIIKVAALGSVGIFVYGISLFLLSPTEIRNILKRGK